ncbi:MAG: hypothetical protein GY756_13015, partial [bacterium]|nr:hypothetical protein [bacterium]
MNKLDIKDFPLVSGIIKDLPQNVIENHSLIQKHATVYHTGSIDNINSLVVKTGYDTGENKCYSSDMDDIIELLGYKGELAGFSINCPDSEYLINKYEKVYSRKLREYKVSSNVLNGSPKIKSEHAVLLSQKDKILLDKASEYFDWFGFKSSEEMLKAGFIAGIIEDDTLVSVAYT